MVKLCLLVISLLIVSSRAEEISSVQYKIVCDHCSLLGNETHINLPELSTNIPLVTVTEPSNSTTNGGTCGNSADDFPNIFTDEQRKNGAIVLHFVIATYCFVLVAIICDNYFIPCVEHIATSLHLSEDVAAATFMSVATSAPELFVNIIGTFITKSDIGIGTIVGSSLFNTLGVASVGGLVATAPIQLLWWPLCRDTTLYICAVSALVSITWDGYIYWYEAFGLFLGYIAYFIIMFQNNRISRKVYALVDKLRKKQSVVEEPEKLPEIIPDSEYRISIEVTENPRKKYVDPPKNASSDEETLTISQETNLFQMPKGSMYVKIYFVYTWPIRFALYWTVPDPKKFPRLFPVTFVMCIVWIGCNSYIVSWLVTMIGYTFGIPDSVLGLTVLGAVGCLGEAFSIGIMSRKGEGKMGVSNAMGANTMNILLSLGMPWFIQTMVLGADSDAYVFIESGSMEYTILGLILVALTLVITLAINKFKLSRITGSITIFFYLCFLTLAIVNDMVFFPIKCDE